MHVLSKQKSIASAIEGIFTLLLFVFIIASLYIAQAIFIPIALATLLTFLLHPLIVALERWIGRVTAIIFVIFIVLSSAGIVGYILTSQFIASVNNLPNYQANIHSKLRAIRLPQEGIFSRITGVFESIKDELFGKEDEMDGMQQRSSPLQVIEKTNDLNFFNSFTFFFGSALSTIFTLGLVLLLSTVMLLNYENLRSRIIRLIGQQQIGTTTRVMDDASQRVSHYLFMQLIINIIYGVLIAVGLFYLDLPNVVLWGAMAGVLRFIPYVGPVLGAIMPVALSLVVSASWSTPLLTISFFVFIELIFSNIVEPWYYGAGTGISSMALIFGAVFWTWLWGGLGLVLATPLTVCMVVVGRHVPKLQFFNILFSDEDALSLDQECYHRLLGEDYYEALKLSENYLKDHSLISLYDDILIPVISDVELDQRQETLEVEQKALVFQNIRDLLEDLADGIKGMQSNHVAIALSPPPEKIVCLPARAERDELVLLMLEQLLSKRGWQVESLPLERDIKKIGDSLQSSLATIVIISVIPPSTIFHARYLCAKLRQRFSQLKIIVGLWGRREKNNEEQVQRLKESGADEVITSLTAALEFATVTHNVQL